MIELEKNSEEKELMEMGAREGIECSVSTPALTLIEVPLKIKDLTIDSI